MSSADPLEVNEEISIFEQSSPESLRARALSPPPHAHDHQRTGSSSEEQILNTDIEDNFSHHKLRPYSSNRSSISSLPASIIHNTLLSEYEDGRRIPSKPLERSDSPGFRLNVPGYMHGFRNPSSVRALQLGDSEYTDTDALSVSRGYRQRKVPKVSYFSPRSPGSTQSSPTKRSSRPGTPQQRSSSKLKKDFPLVLLHCTLLPPATRTPQVSDELYEAVLPEEYKKRWRTLQDKVAKNAEVRLRGVLIPHPHEDYELLEERLLESLELERPRIRQHHYLGSKNIDGIDSGFESSSQTDEGSDAEPEQEKCPDCGKSVSSQVEQERKWQIKVYAANGLMKAGAWAAAWQEMEKVDVEVGVWMPEDVWSEVDERLTSLQAQQEAEKPVTDLPSSPQSSHRPRGKSARARLRHDERMKEIYGESGRSRTQAEIDGLADISTAQSAGVKLAEEISTTLSGLQESTEKRPHVTFAPEPTHRSNRTQPDTISLIQNRFSNIVQDQKSLAILLLTLLVLFFATQASTNKPVKALNPVLTEHEHHQYTSPSQSHPHHHKGDFQSSTEGPAVVSYVTTTIFAPLPPVSTDVPQPEPTFSATAAEEDQATKSSDNIEIEIENTTSEKESSMPELPVEIPLSLASITNSEPPVQTDSDASVNEESEDTASAMLVEAGDNVIDHEDSGDAPSAEDDSPLLSFSQLDQQEQSTILEAEAETEVADECIDPEARVDVETSTGIELNNDSRDPEDITMDE